MTCTTTHKQPLRVWGRFRREGFAARAIGRAVPPRTLKVSRLRVFHRRSLSPHFASTAEGHKKRCDICGLSRLQARFDFDVLLSAGSLGRRTKGAPRES